jgi:diguanylate cyclase (GGDEF)-like protein
MNRLKYLLFYRWRQRDLLTGLWMRRKLFKDLNSALQRSNRVAVIVADVDHFKDVNVAHGHHYGDTVLRQVSSLLPLAQTFPALHS